MKKFAAFFAAAVLAVTLAACIDRTDVPDDLAETASMTTGLTDI